MLLRKIFMSTAAVIFVLCGTALGEEYTEYKNKKMNVGLRLGSNVNVDSDYTDFWDPDLSLTKFWPREISYEYKFLKNIGIELALGYTTMEGEERNISAMPPAAGATKEDRARTDLTNIYFAPSAKFYFPIMENLQVYGGIGPDLYNSKGDILYQRDEENNDFPPTKVKVSKLGYGAHGMIGAEYWLFKNPSKQNFYDWPVSVELQYKYTWAVVEEIDKKLIDRINDPTDGITLETQPQYNDVDVGGHMVTVGVKWYFY